MAKLITPVKGTRDFYPEDLAIRNWIYQRMATVSKLFGYNEYDGPFLEKIDLYAAKSGEELVKEQAFVFPDRGGDLITLRPELTPSLARMIAQKQKSLVFPQRWWSFGPFWRYERPQKGRSREFFQWNIDMLGSSSVEADAEMIAIAATFFKQSGLKPDQVRVFVNSRLLIESELANIGINMDMKTEIFRLIDRREKLSAEVWRDVALSLGVSKKQFDQLNLLITNKELWKKSENLKRVFSILQIMNLDEYVTYDPQIIRGLDYYTDIVFEARDADKDGRAILGGGHYANLVSDVGGDPIPGVGFAMGDVMLRLVLEKYGCLPEQFPAPAQVLVTVFDETFYEDSLVISSMLRDSGIAAILMSEFQKLPRQLKYADRIGVPLVLIYGPEEKGKGMVVLKNLKSRRQDKINLSEMISAIIDLLNKL
jgi:histidyl-tRNA synthetase